MRTETANNARIPVKDTSEQPAANETDYSQAFDAIWNDELLQGIDPSAKVEAAEKTYRLYKDARDYVAPVITNFADTLLTESSGRPVIFAARDGLGAYMAASELRKTFPGRYAHAGDIKYAYLTRNLVWSTPRETLGDYLRQTGIDDLNREVLLADIGMYGSMIPSLRELLPNLNARYLISKTSAIPGYAHGESHHMYSLGHVSGNPGVHFLEDTFSGPIRSPRSLVRGQNGELVPDTEAHKYTGEEALKRKYALRAITDYAAALDHPPDPADMAAVEWLDWYLSDPSHFNQLMVPHER